MNKIIKWIMWALIAVGVVLSVFVFIADAKEDAALLDKTVDGLLYWAVAMAGFGLCAVLFAIGRDASIKPKTLKSIFIVLAGTVVVCGAAYLIAPGSPAIGYTGVPVSDLTLKVTDTILYLAAFAIGAAILATIASLVVDAFKK